MRWIEVDERTSSWERDDARYRVYVFHGRGLATSTTDVLDASVEQALEAARTLSHHDEHLWSLALLMEDDAGVDGLVWLSGMDYHDEPRTRAEWRRRGEMQDRLLAARRRAGKPPVLPDGRRVLRMFPEWASGVPIWDTDIDNGPHLPDAGGLGLSEELIAALRAWNERPLEQAWDAPLPDPEAWIAEGLRLHAVLQEELAGVAEVRREFGP